LPKTWFVFAFIRTTVITFGGRRSEFSRSSNPFAIFPLPLLEWMPTVWPNGGPGSKTTPPRYENSNTLCGCMMKRTVSTKQNPSYCGWLTILIKPLPKAMLSGSCLSGMEKAVSPTAISRYAAVRSRSTALIFRRVTTFGSPDMRCPLTEKAVLWPKRYCRRGCIPSRWLSWISSETASFSYVTCH